MSLSPEKKPSPQVEVDNVSEFSKTGEVEDVTVHRGLKSRHIQLIALGGAIGTGLFIGTGSALQTCGPAPLLISYMVMSAFIWCIMAQLGEMVNLIPLSGEVSIYALSSRYVSRSFSFAAGYNIYYAQAMIVPTEITACGFLVQYWTTSNVAIYITIFCVITILINLSPVQYFGEIEFWVASIKLICLLGLIILGVVIFFGGGPEQHGVRGFGYWNKPGAFQEYLVPGDTGKFLATWTAIIKSGFSFILTPELICSCAAECVNPRKNMKKVCNRFVYRLMFFYVIGSLVIGIMVASDNDKLFKAVSSGDSTAAASPFVIGIQDAGISVLPHIINACILTSAYLCGNTMLYSSSRVLHSMALKGDAPKIFSKVNRFGVPIYSVGVTSLFAFLSYLNVSNSAATVFTWLSNIATISGFISWTFVSTTYLRYRKAMAYHELDHRVPFRYKFQIVAAWSCIGWFSLLALTNGYYVFFPENWSVNDFFACYVTILIIVVLLVGGAIMYKSFRFKKPEEIDLFEILDRADVEAAIQDEPEPRNFAEKAWRIIV